MKLSKKHCGIATIIGILIISIILIISNSLFIQSKGSLKIEGQTTYIFLEPIYINTTLTNTGSKEIELNDFSIDYNIEVHIYDSNNKHIKNLFRTSITTELITIPSGASYNKTLDLRYCMEDNYWYINDDLNLENTFVFEHGTYRIFVNYRDRTGSETVPPLYKSNEISFTIL